MSLKYAKNAVIKGFVGVPDQLAIFGQDNTFANDNTLTAQQTTDKIFTMSNNCRDGSTIFADDQAFLPVSKDMSVQAASMQSTQVTPMAEAPAPPMKKEEQFFVNALLLGAGVFVLYKILS